MSDALSFEFDEDIDIEDEDLDSGEVISDSELGTEESEEDEDDEEDEDGESESDSSDIFGAASSEDEDETEEEDDSSISQTTQDISPAPTIIQAPPPETKIQLTIVKPAISENVGSAIGKPIQILESDKPTPSQIEQAVKPVRKKTPVRKKKSSTSSQTLEELLIKRDEETPEFFAMRSAYAKAASQIFGSQVNFDTAVLLGEMASNRTLYGTTYPEKSNKVLDFISNHILNS